MVAQSAGVALAVCASQRALKLTETISMGGMQKEVVSNQFNCPLNMYSDEAIAEAAMTNKHHSIG